MSFQQAYTLTSLKKNLTKPNKTLTSASARVEGSKLAKKYALEIQQEKEKSANILIAANNTKEAQDALKSIVEQADVDAKLFKILGDDDMVNDIYFAFGKPIPFTRKPTQGEIQKSADLYYKRFGSFSATKIESEVTFTVEIKED